MTLELKSHAAKINEEHRAGNTAALQALDHYRRAGDLLNEVKDALPHGEFGPWLEQNFESSERTARNYMRLASHWPAIETKRQHVANLSLRGALEELSEPKEEHPAPAVVKAAAERKVAHDLRGAEGVAELQRAAEVAKALTEIREKKLYRGTHATFEDYCHDRWGMGEQELKFIFELQDPHPYKLAAETLMVERGLTFKEALDEVTSPRTQADRMRALAAHRRALANVRNTQAWRELYPSFEEYVLESYCGGNKEWAEMVLRKLEDPRAEAHLAILARIFEVAPNLELLGTGIPTMPDDLTFDQHVELFQLFDSIGALYGHTEAA